MFQRLLAVIASLRELFRWRTWRLVCRAFWRVLRRFICRVLHLPCPEDCRRPHREGCCFDLTPDVYKRPDPLLYAQFYLMKQGLAVTWNNPDIVVHEPNPNAPGGIGIAVPSSALQPNHPYKVRVRVWNGSFDAPAVGLPVHLSYLSFGGGTKSHAVGTRYISLGVKGSVHHPAYAVFDWLTPATAGHYCIQARLKWGDDANPNNNLGQENTDVKALQSPAVFEFLLRNDGSVQRRYAIEADAYELPKLDPCDPKTPRAKTRIEESRARWAKALATQKYGLFPIPPEWSVSFAPAALSLAPGEESVIQVSIEPKFAFTGTKSFNVHAFAIGPQGERDLAGGVTLTVTK